MRSVRVATWVTVPGSGAAALPWRRSGAVPHRRSGTPAFGLSAVVAG